MATTNFWDWPGEEEQHMTLVPGKLEDVRFTTMNFDTTDLRELRYEGGPLDQHQQKKFEKLFNYAVRRHLSGHHLSQKLMMWIQALRDVGGDMEKRSSSISSAEAFRQLYYRLQGEIDLADCCSQRFLPAELGRPVLVQRVIWELGNGIARDEREEGTHDLCDRFDYFGNSR
jgi:hypothetical protein